MSSFKNTPESPLDEDQRELFSQVYDELRAIAARLLRKESPDHTFHTTELVHEAYLRIGQKLGSETIGDRAKFFAVAARAMMYILIDHARRKKASKRGSGRKRLPLLDQWTDLAERESIDVDALQRALEELSGLHARQHQAVMLRFFAGLTIAEVAQLTGCSEWTVENDWRCARAWLRLRLRPEN